MPNDSSQPFFTATMMASVPFRDPELMSRMILEYCPAAPRLPIMTRSFRWMYEGLPCLYLDRAKKQAYMLPPEDREAEVLEFYERIEADDLSYFATSQAAAPFFFQIIDKLKEAADPRMKWIGIQFPGPMVLGDSFSQTNSMPAYNHETLWDIIVKFVAMKSRWLEEKLQAEFPGVKVIVDHPEPTLVSFTSAQGTGSRERVIDCINASFSGLEGLRWVHCCSNVDWSILTQSDIDVINFDAYEYADKVALYASEIQSFLQRGGSLGWGLTPVREELIAGEDADSLSERLLRGIDLMVKGGVDPDLLAASSWVLTSCETSLLSSEQAQRAFEITAEVSLRMRGAFS